jgi:alkylated DNA repair dioxygenase AlkB
MTAILDAGSLVEHRIAGRFSIFTARLPDELERASQARFAELWALHPRRFHTITQPFTGRTIPLPRWQQAYGRDYHYSGGVNRALPVPPLLQPYLAWARRHLDARLNGLLLNWYDAALRHYIGPHRDSIVGLSEGAPIVTVSLGATRLFRLRPKGGTFVDFPATDGSVFILPWETNLNVKHAVPHRAGDLGRRISITIRAFDDDLRRPASGPPGPPGPDTVIHPRRSLRVTQSGED